jgi:hypothetical protein
MNELVRPLMLLAALFFGATSGAKAEQGCPTGHYPGGSQPNGQICIPIPGYSGSAAPIQETPEPVWERRWGAIAIPSRDKEGPSELGEGIKDLGIARRKASKNLAQEHAMQDCQLHGEGCKLMLTYHDQCGVVVWGDNQVAFASAQTIDQAEEVAMKDCNQHSANCELYYYDCSYPARTQ